MKIFLIVLLVVIITSCSQQTGGDVQTSPVKGFGITRTAPTVIFPIDSNNRSPKSSLPDMGAASELETTVWLNSDTPLRLNDLKGKVVLLEMWTFGCINCRNVIPSLNDWHTKYSNQGLVIIGNHFPEFDQERDKKNLEAAIKNLQIQYPVTQDNDGKTWRAYKTRFWPTLYLIDKTGHIRHTHIGEGSYKEIELAIQTLLLE
jgi:thiol-disulfide isomerase/thioredoxin